MKLQYFEQELNLETLRENDTLVCIGYITDEHSEIYKGDKGKVTTIDKDGEYIWLAINDTSWHIDKMDFDKFKVVD